ncbi:MAG TPA: PilZ domain-containing protein [Methylomirabilota bacterium]
MRRSSRVGAFERLISVSYVYPFRCQRCTFRFRRLNWGQRYPHATGERRDYERVVVRLPARLTAGAESADAETTDLSISGCAVRTSARFPPGTEVRVVIELSRGQTVDIAQAVVRAAHEGRVSLQFVYVAAEDQRRLIEYINAVALPIDVGRPGRPTPFPLEVVLVAVAGLLVIFLILSMVTRVGTPVR